jgi:hypothetical protein
VLVERVEGFCTENDWLRAYTEINDFEHEIIEAGVIVIKFWLQISQEEQLKRFQEREQIEFKRFKITQEDWRNREKWDDYQVAICDMVERTSTGNAPWTLVEANDKNYARVKILRTICQRLEAELNGRKVPAAGSAKKPEGKADKSERVGKSDKLDKGAKEDKPEKNAKHAKSDQVLKSAKDAVPSKQPAAQPAFPIKPPTPVKKPTTSLRPTVPGSRSRAKI